jgi:hypothetical protein
MSLLTLLSNQSTTQTVVLNSIPSTTTVYNPTVVQAGGTQTITLNTIAATTVIRNPTVIRQASNAISLNLIPATTTVYNPTVVLAAGPQTVVLNAIAATTQVYNPTVSTISLFTDTSDILDRGLKRLRKEEEQVAAQILKSRQSKQEKPQKKKATDWKKLLLSQIKKAETVEQLDAIQIPVESGEITAKVLAEVQKKIEARRLQIETAQREVEAKYLEMLKAEQEAAEFTRKRNNKIKRLKALMWLAKLDL